MSRIADFLKRITAFRVKDSRTRSVLLYLFFVLISAIFWGFLTFNNSINVDVEVPVVITGIPQNVRFLNNIPDTITVNVNDRGTSFIKYMFWETPKLELRFGDYSDGISQFRVDASNMRKLVSRLLNRNPSTLTILPESITAKFTDLPGKLVPVVLDIEVNPAMLYAQNGVIERSADSVVVYGDKASLQEITEVYTYHVKLNDLTDTLHRRVTVSPIKGVVIEPRYIDIMVPIEKMITHTQRIPVSVRNVPNGIRVIVFPSSVDVSFRAPMSAARNHNDEITAVVDYNSIVPGNRKVAIGVGESPGSYQDVRLALDSVEYMIEKQ